MKNLFTQFGKKPKNKCKDIAVMLPLYAIEAIGLTSDEIAAVQKHLVSCEKCKQELNDTKLIISLIDCHRDELLRRGAFDTPALTTPNEQINSGEPDILRPSGINRRWFKTASAIAACLIIVVAIWFSLSQKPSQLPELQPVAVAQPQITVELIDGKSNIAIPSGTTITTNKDEVKTLIINGNRQMALNANTRLMIEPLTQNGVVGCMVKLDIGEVYTHVKHDGKPFIVQTQHGQAIITGTIFDIKATDNTSTLIVSEGSVRFESDNGTVHVLANQQSTIIDNLPPSNPATCNITQLTAWAHAANDDSKNMTYTSLADEAALTDLLLNSQPPPVDLEKIDYAKWIEDNREWFKQNSPCIFQLKTALAKEGIKIDYPELLTKTGDIWQFVHSPKIPAKFSVPNFESLLKVASSYGFDKEWLSKNVPAAKLALQQQLFSESTLKDIKAFDQWLKYTTGEEEVPLPFYSYYAAKYLTETRSLIWFAVKGGKYDLTDEKRADVLALLQKEVAVAGKCQTDMLYPLNKPKEPFCNETLRKTLDTNIVEYIKTMKAVEKKIAENEISK